MDRSEHHPVRKYLLLQWFLLLEEQLIPSHLTLNLLEQSEEILCLNFEPNILANLFQITQRQLSIHVIRLVFKEPVCNVQVQHLSDI